MSASGFSIYDPQQLKNFATGVDTLIENLKTAKSLAHPAVDTPPVKFGQAASISQPLELQGHIQGRTADIEANFQTLIDKLTLLSKAAAAIAQKYTDAAEYDHLSAGDVNAVLNATAKSMSGNG